VPEPSFQWPAPEAARRLPTPVVGLALAVLAAVAATAVGAILFMGGGDEAAVPRGTTPPPTTPPPTTPPPATTPPADGLLAFTRVPDTEQAFGGPGDQAIRALATDGAAAIAGGIDGAGTEGDAALWALSDGTWTRVAAEPDPLSGPGAQSINGVARLGSTVVAVGANRANADEDAAVWVSSGGAFERVCTFDGICGDAFAPGPDRSQKMFGVAAVEGPGLVAVGHDAAGGGFDTAIWRSSDGRTWRRLTLDGSGFAGPGSQEMRGVTGAGGGFVAVGRDGFDAAVWRTSDGDQWTRVRSGELDDGDGEVMNAVAAAGPGLVAVGYEQTPGTARNPAVWTFDGQSWTRVQSPAFRGTGEIRALTAAGDQVVAVGWTIGPAGQDGAVWTSRDGKTWTLVSSKALGGASAQELNAAAPLEAGVVGGGDSPSAVLSDQDAAVWTGLPRS
jgi:hypothetical protein